MSQSLPMSPLSILFVFGEIERATTLQRAGLGAAAVLSAFRGRNDRAPAFLLGERSHFSEIPRQTLRLANEFVWPTEDTSTLIAGRIAAAPQRYRENLLPPMFASMPSQANVHGARAGFPRSRERHSCD